MRYSYGKGAFEADVTLYEKPALPPDFNPGEGEPISFVVGKVVLRNADISTGGVLDFDVIGAIAGKSNEVQVSTDLQHWTTFTNFQTSSNRFRITDVESPTQARRYFRALSR
jgi:hypothetical protein